MEEARVFKNGRSQAVRSPAAYRFRTDEVYVKRDAAAGVVRAPEKPFRVPIEEIFEESDAAGGADFEIERDRSPPPERDLF